jgi:hypothetical protein
MSESKSTFDFLAGPSFRRCEYLFERLGWALMGLILIGAAVGLFGKGWMSEASLQNDQFRMEYERFLHSNGHTTLRLEIPVDRQAEGVIAVAFPNSYLHRFRIERIVPEPESSAHGDQTVFWFTVLKSGQPVTLLFRLEPQEIGKLNGTIHLNGENGYAFHQFVYP